MQVPTSADGAIINAPANYTVTTTGFAPVNSLTGAAGATVEVSLNGSIRNGDSSDPIDNAGVIVLNDDLNHPGLSGTLKGGGQVVLTDGTDGAIITKGMLPRRPGGNRA